MRITGVQRVRAAVGLSVVLAMTGSTFAQGTPSIEGVWAVSIQQRDCTTTAPIGPPIRALVTYHQGGTLTESNGALSFLAGQRSAGHGTWKSGGDGTYTDRSATMLLFETAAGNPAGSPGFQAGWQVAAHIITITGADSFTATGVSQFYNVNRELYRTACASRVGERLK